MVKEFFVNRSIFENKGHKVQKAIEGDRMAGVICTSI